MNQNLNPDKEPDHQESLAPDGAVVDGVSSSFENALATPEESCWNREVIANLLVTFLAPLPPMRQTLREQAAQQWQLAIENIYLSPVLALEDEARRSVVFSDLLQFMTNPDSPCGYRLWWMEHIGDIRKLRAWHVAENLFKVYQDLLKSGWRPETSPAVIASAGARPETEELPQSEHPEPDREPEPTVTPEPIVEIGAPVGMDGATAREVARFIRSARSGYCVEIKKCAGGGHYVEAAAHVERVFRIVTQDDLDDFLRRTKRRNWRDIQADMEAKRQTVLPKAS